MMQDGDHCHSSYGSNDADPTDLEPQKRRRSLMVVIAAVVVCATTVAYFGGRFTQEGLQDTAASQQAVHAQKVNAANSIGVREAEAAAARDFGVVTKETIEAEATMAKYGVRLAETAASATQVNAQATSTADGGLNPAGVHGGWYNYPVKSLLAGAPEPTYYAMSGGGPTFTGKIGDLHAVNGIQTSDGGYVVVGKGVENGNTGSESFAVKFNSAGSRTGAWYSGHSGNDAANAVIQLPSGDLLVGGWYSLPGAGTRALWKLSVSATGALSQVWVAGLDSAATATGGIEQLSISNGNVFIAGLTQRQGADEMSFKSYGNTCCGKAAIMKMPVTKLSGTTPPSAADKAWEVVIPSFHTSKAAHELADGTTAVLLWKDTTSDPTTGATIAAKQAAVAIVKADGTLKGTPWEYPEHYEATDMQISTEGGVQYGILSGQGADVTATNPVRVGLSGRLSKVNLATGARVWTKSYSVGDNDTAGLVVKGIIVHECWGVAVLSDGGYLLACGVGIEQCDQPEGSADKIDCDNGVGDKRPGAFPHYGGTWAELVIRTDINGNQVWRRVDSFKDPAKCELSKDTYTCPAGCTTIPAVGTYERRCFFPDPSPEDDPRGGCPIGCTVVGWQNQGTADEIPPSCTGVATYIPPSCTGVANDKGNGRGLNAISSAAEWAVETSDGGIAVFGDELFGVSVTKYATKGSSTTTTTTPTSSSMPPATT